MIHSGNIIFIIGFTALVVALTAATTVLFSIPYRDEIENARNKRSHKKSNTHIQRLEARLLLASGSVTQGYRK